MLEEFQIKLEQDRQSYDNDKRNLIGTHQAEKEQLNLELI